MGSYGFLQRYYHIEGTEKKDAPGSTGSDLDRQGFDAKRSWATQRREQVAPSAEAEAGVSRHEGSKKLVTRTLLHQLLLLRS